MTRLDSRPPPIPAPKRPRAGRSRLLPLLVGGMLALAARPAWPQPAKAEAQAASAPAPTVAPVRFGPELPLLRDGGAADEGAGTIRGLALSAAILGVFGAVLLRLRARAPGARGGPTFPFPRARWLRQLASGGASPSIEVVQSARLTPRATVHVLRWGSEEWLVGCSEHGVAVLGRRESAPAAPGAPAAAGGSGEEAP